MATNKVGKVNPTNSDKGVTKKSTRKNKVNFGAEKANTVGNSEVKQSKSKNVVSVEGKVEGGKVKESKGRGGKVQSEVKGTKDNFDIGKLTKCRIGKYCEIINNLNLLITARDVYKAFGLAAQVEVIATVVWNDGLPYGAVVKNVGYVKEPSEETIDDYTLISMEAFAVLMAYNRVTNFQYSWKSAELDGGIIYIEGKKVGDKPKKRLCQLPMFIGPMLKDSGLRVSNVVKMKHVYYMRTKTDERLPITYMFESKTPTKTKDDEMIDFELTFTARKGTWHLAFYNIEGVEIHYSAGIDLLYAKKDDKDLSYSDIGVRDDVRCSYRFIHGGEVGWWGNKTSLQDLITYAKLSGLDREI